MEYAKVIIETSKSIYRYLLKIEVTSAEAKDIVQDTIQKIGLPLLMHKKR
ncbi:RNA polymerase subunit sigma-70 [Bacillus mycoides]